MDLTRLVLTISLLMPANEFPSTMLLQNEQNLTECEGNDIVLSTEINSTLIITSEWMYSRENDFSNTNETLCETTIHGGNNIQSNSGKDVDCNKTHFMFKNISLNDVGYYLRHSLLEGGINNASVVIFLTVIATPNEQCIPVISNHNRNELKCTTPCEKFGIQWKLNKTGTILGNQSISPISCPLTEVFLCCLDVHAMRCQKGNHSLCKLVTPDICKEHFEETNVTGDENNNNGTKREGSTTVPAQDNSNSNLWALLTFIPLVVILIVVYKKCWKKAKSGVIKITAKSKEDIAASGKLLDPGKKPEPPIPSKDEKAEQESNMKELNGLGSSEALNIRGLSTSQSSV